MGTAPLQKEASKLRTPFMVSYNRRSSSLLAQHLDDRRKILFTPSCLNRLFVNLGGSLRSRQVQPHQAGGSHDHLQLLMHILESKAAGEVSAGHGTPFQ